MASKNDPTLRKKFDKTKTFNGVKYIPAKYVKIIGRKKRSYMTGETEDKSGSLCLDVHGNPIPWNQM